MSKKDKVPDKELMLAFAKMNQIETELSDIRKVVWDALADYRVVKPFIDLYKKCQNELKQQKGVDELININLEKGFIDPSQVGNREGFTQINIIKNIRQNV